MAAKTILVCLMAYGLGCLSPGYWLVRWRCGIDIRTIGSGATGAFNVGRVLKTPGFALTLLGDVLKGVLALALAYAFGLPPLARFLVLTAVVVGHDFPAQLGFRGGNGLAPGGGALLLLDPWLTLMLALFFCLSLPILAILKALFKLPIRVYTPSKLTIVAAPLLALLLGRGWLLALGLAAVVALILWTMWCDPRRRVQVVS